MGVGFGTQLGGPWEGLLFPADGGPAIALPRASSANDIDGNVVVATGAPTLDVTPHALMWRGTPQATVDLHPAGYVNSSALGVRGTQQVGYAQAAGGVHAMLWSGTAASATDLHPAGYDSSTAQATDGSRQGGWGMFTDRVSGTLVRHALLWSGGADSAVNLTPTGSLDAQIHDMAGEQQVGEAMMGSSLRAILWHGTAGSAVDLTPPGYGAAVATGTNGLQQVGYGVYAGPPTGGTRHALLWSGSAAGVVNLHDLLPDDFTLSIALGIDEAGNVYGYGLRSGQQHAIVWRAVPDPSTATGLVVAATALLRRRARHKVLAPSRRP
jgi:hypothetical protein